MHEKVGPFSDLGPGQVTVISFDSRFLPPPSFVICPLFKGEFCYYADDDVLESVQIYSLKDYQPIRGQYLGHVISLDQSEASIKRQCL